MKQRTIRTGLFILFAIIVIILAQISFGYFATYGFELYYQMHPLPLEEVGNQTVFYTTSI